MKITIVDEMRDRGKSIRYCIEKIFEDADFTEILEQNATGPQARAEIPKYADQYDYIFVHHGQLDLAEQLSDTPRIILYTSFYQKPENMDESWICEDVSVNKGVSEGAILEAMMRSIGETQIMGVSIVDELSGWHALAAPNLKHREGYIQAIEKQHGGGQNTNEYRRLYLQKPDDAFRFAEGIKSAIKNRGIKDDQSLRHFQAQEYAKREFKVLFVDDNEDNYILLEKKLKQYLLDNDEPFEIKIIHSLTTEKLVTQLKELQNVQAVIFDDRFPTNVNISEIIEKLVAIRPSIPFYIFGSEFPVFIDGELQDNILLTLPNVKAYEYKDEKRAIALFDGLMADLKTRIETPYFTAVNKYAIERKSAFHALPLTDGGSVNDSVWTREFTDFYKRKFFAAETSNTKAPLSSVFSPHGELKRALEKAAKAFRADKTLFVTSGTTISNLLVYKIHIRKGDIVLLDWNCHKSHHNAIVECGARVKYLKSSYNKQFGISGLVQYETIIQELESLKEAKKIVKMISLTHPSFDGILYNVEKIMREANKIFPGIVFFFDEAWFAYGAFFPDQEIRHRSAMHAATKIRQEAQDNIGYSGFPNNDVRVYVTHSIHKTLSSIRQGSMVHIHDPYLKFAKEADRLHLEFLIDNAYETYITTSPNNSILASLDVARMQAEIEGYDRINRAKTCVKVFKNKLESMCKQIPAVKALGLRIIEPKELVSNSSADNVLVDPLKVTLYFDRVSGAKAVKQLNEFNIQINKYSANTVLLLFSIGVTLGNVNHLLLSLKNWADDVMNKPHDAVMDKLSIDDERLGICPEEIPDFHNDFLAGSDNNIVCLKDVYDKLHENQIPDYANSDSYLFLTSKSRSISECLNDGILRTALDAKNLVAAQAITPYPPGSPVIVPGQILTKEILESLIQLKKIGGEIHGVVRNSSGKDCIIVSNRNL